MYVKQGSNVTANENGLGGLRYVNSISATLEDINNIVNLKWLSEKLIELKAAMSTCKTLILHWNCDGISTKVEELTAVARRDGIHVILLNKLRITARFKLRIRGYVPYVLRNNNAHGGVAALIREDVPHRRVELRDVRLLNAEAVAVQLEDGTTLVAFYNSPQKRLLQDELEALFALGRKIVLAGDFNATHAMWGCHRNNANGNTLHRFVNENNVILHDPGEYTHFPHNGTSPNTLDLVITSNVAEIFSIKTRTLPSDHAALQRHPGYRNARYPCRGTIATCQSTSATSSVVEIDSANCFSVRATARIERNSSGCPRQSVAAYANTGTRSTRRDCAASIRGTAPFGGSTSTYDRSEPRSTQSTTLTARQPCRIEISRQISRGRSRNIIIPRKPTPQQNYWWENPFVPFTFKILSFPKLRLTPGNDNIQNHVLKHIPRKTFAQFIFNAALKLQHFPSAWKTATVVPVPKPGNEPRLATTYRPISLLPAISKIFEKILLRHVNKYTNHNSVLPPEQFGFRRKHSTNHQVARVVTDVISAFNKRQHTAMMLVDMEKAFDRVWIEGLIHKLIVNGYPPPIVRILHSYLKDRQFAVKVNNEISDLRSSTAGVPQGSVLGPVLFNLYTSDIPKFPNNSIATYADDTAIYAHSFSQITAVQKLQNQIPSYERYLSTWKLTANPSKSSIILFTRSTNPVHIPRYPSFFNSPLIASNEVKYLGIVLDKRLTFKNAVNNNVKKTNAAIRSLLYIMINRNVSIENKILLFKAVLRPILTTNAYELALGADRYTPIRELHRAAHVDTIVEYAAKQVTRFYAHTRTHVNPFVAGITTAPLGKHPHIFPGLEELQ
ncbi:hypothetical protein Trydic_g12935 [Trypoxylus dichotomus]